MGIQQQSPQSKKLTNGAESVLPTTQVNNANLFNHEPTNTKNESLQNIRATHLKIHGPADSARIAEAQRLWRKADAVCFDVDSTVCQNEAIDDFAEFLGVSEEVTKCTREAMSGQMTFREALRRRLDLMRPTRKQLQDFKQHHLIRLTPGIIELVSELQQRHVDIYLVSGGFRSIIRPVAEVLKISANNIYANEILFDEDGQYAGFDLSELTSDSGSKNVGKAGVCGQLKAKKKYNTLIMIGDGATDAEASPPADSFIGFGFNQMRESVCKLADWYVVHFDELRNELNRENKSEN